MASSRRQMKGWQYSLDDESEITGDRRRGGRNVRAATQIVLRRESDGLDLKVGDCVVVEDEEDEEGELPSVGLIKEILFGTDSFLEIRVFWFYRISEVDQDILPGPGLKNEVFLSAVVDRIQLSNILGRCTVVSEASLAKMVLDESNEDTTFVCRRFCDSDGEYFTDAVDWDVQYDRFQKNTEEFYMLVKNMTVKPTVKSFSKKLKKKGIDPMKVQAKSRQKQKRKVRYEESESDVDDEDADGDAYMYESDSDEIEEIENIDSDSDDEPSDEDFRVRPERGTGRGRKRGRRKAQKAFKRGQMPSLPKVSRKFLNEDEKELDIDSALSTKSALRKAKKVLHTSAKLHSLPCREDEFSQLFYTLEGAVQSKTGRCIYVSGTPGVGKTATIREVIKQLSASFLAETGKKAFNYVEINGLKLISPQASYEVLWEKVSGKKATASRSVGLLEDHFNKEDKCRLPLVVLLDEMDQIVTKNQSVMYNFFNWPSYQHSRLVVIAVANTMDLPERLLSNKISSRLGLTRVQFSSYTYPQLSEIIKSRLEKLGRLNEERMVISKDAVAFASRKVASVSGDARRALMICIRAVEIAEAEFQAKSKDERHKLDGKYTVTIMHIMKAVNETASSPITNYLSSLSFMGKMFLLAILLRMKRTGLAEITVGEIIDEMNNQFHMILFGELKKRLEEEELEQVEVLYNSNRQSQLRPTGLAYLVKEFEENGILIVQKVRLERARMVRLNISEDEVIGSFKKDVLVRELYKEI